MLLKSDVCEHFLYMTINQCSIVHLWFSGGGLFNCCFNILVSMWFDSQNAHE